MKLADEEDKLPAQLDADIIQKRFLLSREDLQEVRRCRGAILRICYTVTVLSTRRASRCRSGRLECQEDGSLLL